MESILTEDNLSLTKEEDLRFLRASVKQARRDFDPGTPIYITWGLICFLGYTGTHILVTQQAYRWINPLWFGLLIIGGILSGLFGYRLTKSQRKKGFISHIDTQINWIWGIAVGNGLLWSLLGYFKDPFGGPGFYWALIYALALCMTGIVYAREWLGGGFFIIAGMLAAHFSKSFPYVIIGIAMAIGCIVPSIIARNRLKKMEMIFAEKD